MVGEGRLPTSSECAPPPVRSRRCRARGAASLVARHEVAARRVDLVGSGHAGKFAERGIGRWVAQQEIAVAKPGDKADAPSAARQGMNAKSAASSFRAGQAGPCRRSSFLAQRPSALEAKGRTAELPARSRP